MFVGLFACLFACLVANVSCVCWLFVCVFGGLLVWMPARSFVRLVVCLLGCVFVCLCVRMFWMCVRVIACVCVSSVRWLFVYVFVCCCVVCLVVCLFVHV